MAMRCLTLSSELWKAPYRLFEPLRPPPSLGVMQLDTGAIFRGRSRVEGSNSSSLVVPLDVLLSCR